MSLNLQILKHELRADGEHTGTNSHCDPRLFLGWRGLRWCTYIDLLSGPDLKQKFDPILAPSASSVSYTFRPQLGVSQAANDVQWNTNRAQPYSGAKPTPRVSQM